MPSSCRVWTQPDGLHFRGLCSNDLLAQSGAQGCNVCAIPIGLTPPTYCFECPGDWPVSYRLRGGFAMSGAAMSGELMYTAENASWIGERNAYSFPWTWAEVNSYLNEAVVYSTQSQCTWCCAMTSLCFCRAAQDFVSSVASCGAELNHKAARTSWVLNHQMYKWPQLLQLNSGGVPARNYCYNSPFSVNDGGASYSADFGGPVYTPDIRGRYPSGYGSLSGTTISGVPIRYAPIGYGGVILDQPLFPGCPDAEETGGGVGVFRNRWFGVYFIKHVAITVYQYSPGIGLANQMAVAINIDHGGICEWDNWYNKIMHYWRKPDYSTGLTIPYPANDLAQNRSFGRMYLQTPDCDSKTRIRLDGPVGGIDPFGWPESIWLIAGT